MKEKRYYRLKDRFWLRGWERLSWVIVDPRTGKLDFLDDETMSAIDLCNGNIDITIPLVSDQQRKIIAQYEEKGFVEPCEPGHGLNKKQEYHLYNNCYVSRAHWSITGKCNYNCRHCFMSAPESKLGELPHDEIISIARQLGECGIMRVSLTGGEPLIRDDFFELLDTLLEQNISITEIYTNGALVNEKLLDEFEKRKIHPEFSMSFDGVGWHDWLRGINGAEKLIDRAFRLCKERCFTTTCEMCIHKLNKHVLRESMKYLGSVGLSFVQITPVVKSKFWEKNQNGANISIKDFYQLVLDYIPQYYEDNMPVSVEFAGLFKADLKDPDSFEINAFVPDENVDDYCFCGHARKVVYISPEGRVLPCNPLAGIPVQEEFPLIQENGLANCLSESHYMNFITRKASEIIRYNSECRDCEYAKYCCCGCRAEAYYSCGDIMGKSNAHCEMYKGGWIHKVLDTMRKVRPQAKSSVYGDSFLISHQVSA